MTDAQLVFNAQNEQAAVPTSVEAQQQPQQPEKTPENDAPPKKEEQEKKGGEKEEKDKDGDGDAKKGKEDENDQGKQRERDKMFKKFQKAQDEILGGVGDLSGFDVYQMCAFLSRHAKFLPLEIMAIAGDEPEELEKVTSESDRVHKDKRGRTVSRHSTVDLARRIPSDQRVTKWQYYLCLLRAGGVAALQIWSLVLTIEELMSQTEVCRGGTFDIYSFNKASTKIVYAGYVGLIGVNVLNWINDLKTSGMYSALVDTECILPDLLDQGWLLAGRTINYVVLIFSIWASFLLIYLSDSVLDMILNSLALYFVLELDNMVMSPRDYKQVAAYVDAYQWDLEERVTEYMNRKEQPIVVEHREWNVFKILFDLLVWLISTALVGPVIYFTAFIAFCVAPIYYIVCL